MIKQVWEDTYEDTAEDRIFAHPYNELISTQAMMPSG